MFEAAEQPKRYRAFISYSQKDKDVARRLHRALEAYRLAKDVDAPGVNAKTRKVGRFFRDDDELGAAYNLGAALKGAIDDSESLIVLCSPYSAASEWVDLEVRRFKSRGAARVFAVVLSGTPNAEDPNQECFCPALKEKVGAQGELTGEPDEPLAPDLRKDGFSRLTVRLVAGLLGLSFDDLWRRERRRTRARRLLFGGAAAAALSVLAAGGLALFAPNQVRLAYAQAFTYGPFAKSAEALSEWPDLSVFQDCRAGSSHCPEMVVLPAGDYLMGQAPGQRTAVLTDAAMSEQGTQRRVAIARFAVSKTEITFDHWAACVAGGGCQSQPSPSDAGWGRGARPVINVSWEDGLDYVAWLSHVTGAEYRLLEESEWEYAARGVTSAEDARNGDLWGFGDDESRLAEHAWFVENTDVRTQPVGLKKPNAFNLHDMHGNVSEWLQDCFVDLEAETRTSEILQAKFGDRTSDVRCPRNIRGGSWHSGEDWLHSSARDATVSTNRFDFIGLRVARSLSEGASPQSEQ